MLVYRYGTTWADLGRMPLRQSWAMLRALRQDPPGLTASDGDRRDLFIAALEQSEQFFLAATEVGTQTRGLLLYYGMAQAGRALRAAQDDDANWQRDGGHGITVQGGSTDGAFADARVADSSGTRGAYGRVASSLNRASLPVEKSVGDLSRLLWQHARFPLRGAEPPYPALQLTAVTEHLGPHAGMQLGSQFLRADLAVPANTWELEMPDGPARVTADYDAYRAHVRKMLGHYPTLTGAELVERAPGFFQLRTDSEAERKLELVWHSLPPLRELDDPALHRFSDETERSVQVWPAWPEQHNDVGGIAVAPRAAHPFMLWWAVLYVMAHYVRYEPAAWSRLVNVDASPEAVAIEDICERALVELPELIHRTLVRTEPQWHR